MCSTIIEFTLLAICCIAFTSADVCTGCPSEHDANDPEVRTKLTSVLATANSPHEVKRIISVHKQVVAGMKFIVKFENQDDKECNASWVEQPWISKEPQYVEFSCP